DTEGFSQHRTGGPQSGRVGTGSRATGGTGRRTGSPASYAAAGETDGRTTTEAVARGARRKTRSAYGSRGGDKRSSSAVLSALSGLAAAQPWSNRWTRAAPDHQRRWPSGWRKRSVRRSTLKAARRLRARPGQRGPVASAGSGRRDGLLAA